jgi:Family of unknown function (DUF6356)
MRSLFERCRDHLDAVGEDYGAHRRFASFVGWSMVVAGVACILHGLVPAVFTDTASRTIRRLHAVIEHREAHHEAAGRSGAPLLAAFALFYGALPWAVGVPPLFALPLSLISLAYLPAYWWSELRGAAGPLEA